MELKGFYNMDCMEGMKEIPDKYFDLAIVDPPYGVNMDKGFTGADGFAGKGKAIKRTQYSGDWDKEPPNKKYFEELSRVSKQQIIWGGNFFTDNLPKSGHWVFWNKRNTMPTHGDGELAWTSFGRKSVKLFEYTWNGLMQEDMKNKEVRLHPTQKPVALYHWLLNNYAKEGDKILDTHVGSASSLIACHDLKFEYLGFELDEDYYNTATERIKKHIAQVDIFDLI